MGENLQLELRPAPQSVGRLHESGLVDSLLFTTKPASDALSLVPRLPHPAERGHRARVSPRSSYNSAQVGYRRLAWPCVSKDGPRATVPAAHGSRRAPRA